MKFKKGCALINIYDFIESLYRSADEATQRDIADSLACLDPVIDHVAAQIVTGYTEFLSSGATDYPAKAEPRDALDRARRYVAENAGEVAKLEIERLTKALKSREEEAKRNDWLFTKALDLVLERWGDSARYDICSGAFDAEKAREKAGAR